MRIIDKNTDFYDYVFPLDKDSHLIFERHSFELKRSQIIRDLSFIGRPYGKDYYFILLHVGSTYWLFTFNVTKRPSNYNIEDGEINLLNCWLDYNSAPCLITLDVIDFEWVIRRKPLTEIYTPNMCKTLTNKISTLDYKTRMHLTEPVALNDDDKQIPLLKSSGLTKLIDPQLLYLSFEECFSARIKTSERTQSVGLTNDEKITNHGFDLKNSFRGRNTT